ncbi:MAG: serine/threonine protein kinase [Lentisphaeria bacterium]|nr:serine/threonine protein kinase [Lentisphaeria bacterium]
MSHAENEIIPRDHILGGYRIEREVGRGAMAIVYRAIQLNLERPVALKVLSPELASDTEFVARFFNEARAAAALSHANIIQAYDAGLDEGRYYFAMEFVEGRTVLELIEDQGALPVANVLEIAEAIADALNYGWQRQQLTHGDIKPENIMRSVDGETKLADFGLAKVAGHDYVGTDIMLTPLYAAPEMIRGEQTKGDCRADIYCYGASLYHMLCGSPPFPGEKADQVIQRHLHEPLVPPARRNPQLSAPVSDFVCKLLAKEPGERPQDWEAVLTGVRRIRSLAAKRRRGVKKAVPLGQVQRRAVPVVTASTGAKTGAWTYGMIFVGLAALILLMGWLVADKRGWLHSANGKEPSTPPVKAVVQQGKGTAPPFSPPTTEKVPVQTEPRQEQGWEHARQQIVETGNPERGLARLEEYRRDHPDELPEEFFALLEEYTKALEWRNAQKAAADGTTLEPVPGADGQAPRLDDDGTGQERSAAFGGSRENQRDDAYVELIFTLSKRHYVPGIRLDAGSALLAGWLARYPEESERKSRVAFLAGTVLPELAEFIPKLQKNSAALIGKSFPHVIDGREVRRELEEIDDTSIVFAEKGEYGKVKARKTWSELGDTRFVVRLSYAAFGMEKDIEERRVYLAVLLFTGHTDLIGNALKGWSEAEEARLWRSIGEDFDKISGEMKYLGVWRSILKTHSEGNFAATRRLCEQLQKAPSEVGYRYREELAKISEACAEAAPEAIAGRMVREAADAIKLSPREALAKLTLTSFRHGRLSFPEAEQMESLRDSVLKLLQVPDVIPARRQIRMALRNFVLQNNLGIPPSKTMVAYRSLQAREQLGNRERRELPVLKVAMLLESGEWGKARKEAEKLELEWLADRAPATAAVGAYVAALTKTHYARSTPELANSFQSIHAALGREGEGGKTFVAALLPRLAVCTRQFDVDPDRAVPIAIVDPLRGGQEKADFYLCALILHLEAGRERVAQSMLRMLSQPSMARRVGLADPDVVLLSRLHGFLTKDEELSTTDLPVRTGDGGSRARVLVSSISTHRPDSSADVLDWAWRQLVSSCGSFGPVGGGALYDLAVLRVSRALRSGDGKGALVAVDEALDLSCPALFGYYTDLCFLKAAIGTLTTNNGLRYEAQVRVQVCCASQVELALAKLLEEEGGNEQIRAYVKENPRGRYWYEWIVGASRLVADPERNAAGFSKRMKRVGGSRRISAAERELSETAVLYIQKKKTTED